MNFHTSRVGTKKKAVWNEKMRHYDKQTFAETFAESVMKTWVLTACHGKPLC